MFEYMGDRISNAIKNIKGMGRITEDNINDMMREIERVMLLRSVDTNWMDHIDNMESKVREIQSLVPDI